MKYVIFTIYVLYSNIAFSQQNQYVFIGELQLQKADFTKVFTHKIYQELSHVFYSYSKNRIQLKVVAEILPGKEKLAKARKFSLDSIRVYITPKEKYWTPEQAWSEVRIVVSKEIYDLINKSVHINLLDKNGTYKTTLTTEERKIYLEKDNLTEDYGINNTTFKIKQPIYIGTPEDIGLDISLYYLHQSLDSSIIGTPDFKETARDLDYFIYADSVLRQSKNPSLQKTLDSTFLNFERFKDFSSLMLFIEPYLNENSFFNQEAVKLNDSIKVISSIIEGMDEKRIDSTLNKKLFDYNHVYNDYQIMNARLTSYSKYLQSILFQRRINCFAINNLDSSKKEKILDTLLTPRFTLGVITFPIKLRLGSNFDFQSTLSIGATGGIKFRLSKFNTNSLNLLFGASVSTTSIDSSRNNPINPLPSVSNLAVFSPSIGLAFGFNKAHVGIFYGWDFLNKSLQSRYNWIYDKKPWLSLGLGVSLFTYSDKR